MKKYVKLFTLSLLLGNVSNSYAVELEQLNNKVAAVFTECERLATDSAKSVKKGEIAFYDQELAVYSDLSEFRVFTYDDINNLSANVSEQLKEKIQEEGSENFNHLAFLEAFTKEIFDKRREQPKYSAGSTLTDINIKDYLKYIWIDNLGLINKDINYEKYIQGNDIQDYERISYEIACINSLYTNAEETKRRKGLPVNLFQDDNEAKSSSSIQKTPEEYFDLGQKYEQDTENWLNSSKAAAMYLNAARKGHVNAQFQLGLKYKNGTGIKHSPLLAVEWFDKAAEQGHADASYELGKIYQWGEGVEKDLAKTHKWYKSASAQGHADASFELGSMYRWGYERVKQDLAKAHKWYERASAQGHAYASYMLGRMYEEGEGVKQDYTEAKRWYQLAAQYGYPDAQNKVQQMTQLIKARIQEDLRSADSQNDVPMSREGQFQNVDFSQINLGSELGVNMEEYILLFPLEGIDEERDEDKKNNLRSTQYNTDWTFGKDQDVDPENLGSNFEKFDNQDKEKKTDNSEANPLQKEQGKFYSPYSFSANLPFNPEIPGQVGGGNLNSIDELINNIEAANLGDPNAQYSLGMKYRFGLEGLSKNTKLAKEYFQKAANQGHIAAQEKLMHSLIWE